MPKVLIKAANYSCAFDDVVVTVPLGCLKRGKPAYIANASYSSLEKVYISFPADFWDSQLVTAGAQLPSFFHFLNPAHVPDQQRSWTIEVVPLSSSALFGDERQPTLLFNQLSPTDPEYFKRLTEFFRPYYSLLPNYRPSHPDCIPTAALATNWQNDELAGNGSYTKFQVIEDGSGDEVQLDDDIRAMRAGLPERGVWFAGEHMAPFVALGTSTGAYWSGESVGVRILVANGLL